MIALNKKQRGALAVEGLKKLYPQAKCSLEYTHPYELLIATRLSAQCTDARVNIVTKDLFTKYKTLESLANADVADIENIIKSCGLFKTKAKDVVLMCRQLIENYDGTLPDSIEELTSLSGIGRKTANLIMGDIFGKPAVVADTHCIRICNRIGLVATTDPKKVELELKKILDPLESNDFCHRLVLFGRDVCTARKANCENCVLEGCCKKIIKK